MTHLPVIQSQMTQLDVPLDRDVFLRTLIRELAGTLEVFDVPGMENVETAVCEHTRLAAIASELNFRTELVDTAQLAGAIAVF